MEAQFSAAKLERIMVTAQVSGAIIANDMTAADIVRYVREKQPTWKNPAGFEVGAQRFYQLCSELQPMCTYCEGISGTIPNAAGRIVANFEIGDINFFVYFCEEDQIDDVD